MLRGPSSFSAEPLQRWRYPGELQLHNDVLRHCSATVFATQAAVHVSASITEPNIAKDMPLRVHMT
jgi:hypothetical protein